MNRSGPLVMLHRMVCFAAVFAATQLAVAQRAPQRPTPEMIQATTPYNSADAGVIAAYGTYWAGQIADSDGPDAVERAAREMSTLLTGPLPPTALFRRELSQSVVPALSPAVTGDDLHKAVNAMTVLANLGTRSAARVLQDQLDRNQQSMDQIRIRASRGLQGMLQFASLSPTLTDINERDLMTIVRDLESSCAGESNALVKRYTFEAIAAAHSRSLGAPTQEVIRTSLINAMVSALGNAANGAPSAGELEALYVGTNRLYAIYLQLAADTNAQRSFGVGAAKVIRRVAQSASNDWEELQADSRSRQVCAITLQLCEQFFGAIDQMVRPGQGRPNYQLRSLWEDADESAFNTNAQQLITLLGRAPYGAP